jgi:hypothetical protein
VRFLAVWLGIAIGMAVSVLGPGCTDCAFDVPGDGTFEVVSTTFEQSATGFATFSGERLTIALSTSDGNIVLTYELR